MHTAQTWLFQQALTPLGGELINLYDLSNNSVTNVPALPHRAKEENSTQGSVSVRQFQRKWFVLNSDLAGFIPVEHGRLQIVADSSNWYIDEVSVNIFSSQWEITATLQSGKSEE